MITEAETGGVMQTQVRTPGALSWRRKLRLDNSDVRIHLSYSKAHAFGQQQYPPDTNTENEEKKGRMESSFQITVRADGLTEWITEFFADNRKSRWIN